MQYIIVTATVFIFPDGSQPLWTLKSIMVISYMYRSALIIYIPTYTYVASYVATFFKTSYNYNNYVVTYCMYMHNNDRCIYVAITLSYRCYETDSDVIHTRLVLVICY